MNKIVGIILILVGGLLLYKGTQRKDSLAGGLDRAGTSIANSVDGGSRIPEHYYYLIGGGVLVAVGIGTMAAGRRSM